MTGKSFYCEYCKHYMGSDINVRKKHNALLTHHIAKANYFAEYKDPREVYAEESRKIPCKGHFKSLHCAFGAYCHFTHYSPEELAQLKLIADKVGNQMNMNQSQSLPWKYLHKKMNPQTTTPSLQTIDVNKVAKSTFQAQWGV